MKKVGGKSDRRRSKPHVMIVGPQDSIHLARWLLSIDRRYFDVSIFPINEKPIHAAVVSAGYINVRHIDEAPPLLMDVSRSQGVYSIDVPLPRRNQNCETGQSTIHEPSVEGKCFGGEALALAIRRIRPDIIHSMEFQSGGYVVMSARQRFEDCFPFWLASNWGSDIYFYSRFESHRRKIVQLLSKIDGYAAECTRDVIAARALGYQGPCLPITPASGGFDLNRCRQLRSPGTTSQRRLIMVKGYEHFAGRAITSLEILRLNADALRDYEVVCVFPSPNVLPFIEAIRSRLTIQVLSHANYEEVLALYGRARVYIGLGISDGISTAVLESMVMGCFPIQTDTSCCSEWFEDGVGGFVVRLEDRDEISSKLRQALTDDRLVNRAALVNWETAKSRLRAQAIKTRVAKFYHWACKSGRPPVPKRPR